MKKNSLLSCVPLSRRRVCRRSVRGWAIHDRGSLCQWLSKSVCCKTCWQIFYCFLLGFVNVEVIPPEPEGAGQAVYVLFLLLSFCCCRSLGPSGLVMDRMDRF